jgi:hypothetical protein
MTLDAVIHNIFKFFTPLVIYYYDDDENEDKEEEEEEGYTVCNMMMICYVTVIMK